MDRGLPSITTGHVPERGRRPENRRELTLGVAADLFYRCGYANVSMADIAAAVNMGGSAIYRHFPNKASLLVAAIEAGIAPFEAVIDETDLAVDDRGFEALAGCALDNPQLGVLWQREARNLGEDDRRHLRVRLRGVSAALATRVGARWPALRPFADLAAWCELGVLVSVGFHSVSLPRSDYVTLLTAMQREIVQTVLSDVVEWPGPSADRPLSTTSSRRDRVVDNAAVLFSERGYGAVTVDEIGESVGIRGPSLYNHFSNKQQLLAETIRRGDALLTRDVDQIIQQNDDPALTLRRLLRSYIRVTIEHRSLMRTVLSEIDELEQADRSGLRRRQRDYIELWTDLLGRAGGHSHDAARIIVQAVLLLINDAVQTPHLREQPGFELALERLADRLLAMQAESQGRSAGR